MMKKFNKVLSLLLAFAMTLTMLPASALAAQSGDAEDTFTVERLDRSDVTANLIRPGESVEEKFAENFADTDMVRVMIVLEDAPAIELMHSVDDALSSGSEIAEQREYLINVQHSVTDAISAAIGSKLDVQWNLTLVTNAISANVEYGKIDEIAGIEGVKAVYMEVRYIPLKAETSNIISQQMTGASAVQNTGYTGAGTRIAVIDTGTDTDHQSFDGGAFEYALAELAAKKGMSYDEYVATLNLLSIQEVASVLEQLHIYSRTGGEVTAEDLYLSSKLPFNYNYAGLNLSIDHEDNNNEHGSHVAGISTANRYIDCTKVYDFNGTGDFDMDDVQTLLDFVTGIGTIENVDYADLSGNGTISTYDVHLLLDVLEEYEANGAYYLSAFDTVHVTGVAPDAQLLTMKVFSEDGGAYASDYMAAVEDSIVLGCDVVNLSLGTASPGFNASYGSEWSEFVNGIMERVAESGIVMSVAAGNSGSWAAYSENGVGMMYTDEAGAYTTGEPATYENALSVASANNASSVSSHEIGFWGAYGDRLPVSPYNAVIVPESETEYSYLSSFSDMDTIDPDYAPTTYELVFLGDPSNLFNGVAQQDQSIYAGDPSDFEGYDFTGKVVLVARGGVDANGEGVYFSTKHLNAALAGAAAVVIYNNVSGPIQPSVDENEYADSVPCAGISFEEARALYNAFALNKQGLYAGSFTVCKRLSVDLSADVQHPTMSSFSSWGATGDLRIKPEITAPGGSIYSVNGLGTAGDQYEVMSGTSMAAPHLSGLAALLNQYFRENGILEKTGLSSRVLAQSLLMSTAVPMIEYADIEYSVRTQGAGLANVQNAMKANAYIMVTGQDDGKVKAELGDGTHDRVVEFTITNFGNKDLTYDLSASVLTTGTVYYNDTYYTADSMTKLDADVFFSADRVTVAAGDSVTVTAVISVSDEAVTEMEEMGYVNGFFLEGFLYIVPDADSEGVVDASHSIPLLGWYGDWSDPSMFDSGNIFDYLYNNLDRLSHVDSHLKNVLTWEPVGYGEGIAYTGNLYGSFSTETVYDEVTGAEIGVKYISDGDQRYIEARNAISSLPDTWWHIYAIFPSLIRNVGDFKIQVTDADTGELYYIDDYEQYDDMMVSSYFSSSYGQWFDSTGSYGVGLGNWEFTDLNGDPLPEGTRITVSLSCVPEYLVDENGKVDWNSIEQNENNTLSYSFTIDNTFPELDEDSLVYDKETNTLTFTAKDNNYIAAAVLLNGSASQTLGYYFPDMDEDQRGTAVSSTLDLGDYEGRKIAIAICDYAGNEVVYAINLGGEGASYGSLIGFQPDPNGYVGSWVAFDTDVNKNETALFAGTADIVCAEYVNGHVYAQDENGKLYGIPYEALLADSVNLDACYITTLDRIYQDLAYNYVDGKLYAMFSGEDEWGLITEVYTISLTGGYNDYGEPVSAYTEDEWPTVSYPDLFALTMAIDDTGMIYILGMPIDWNTGKQAETARLYMGDTSGYWVDLREYGDTGLKMDYLQSMTWDHNTETLYWARFYPESLYKLNSELIQFSFNEDGTPVTDEEGMIVTKVVGTLTNETCALIAPLSEEAAAKEEHLNVPEFDASVIATPNITVDAISLGKDGTNTLSCTFDPWYSNYKDVVWTSSDETVAVVDQNGVVTAKSDGSCVITAANAEDETLFDTCSVTVASLTLDIEGIISYTSGGLNSVTGSKLYNFSMNNGVANLELGNLITAPDELSGYGLNIASAIHAKGSIWACEFGNSGMIYEIDPLNGMVKDVLMPIDGDMMFGLSYSEATGMFTGIMNFYMYVDLPLTHEVEDDMLGSYDEELKQFTWHRINMLDYLVASQGSFVTGETGQGASSEIVFCGITDIDNTMGTSYSLTSDFMGGYNMEASYTPVTTHVLLDNVGRLWYIDEITNMYLMEDYYFVNRIPTEEELNNWIYPEMMISIESNGVFNTVYHVDEDTDLYNVFVIREIEETPLTDMFREGTMPRITYHFSDIYYAGETPEGAPVFYLSLYDYWNEGSENLLYLLIGSVGTGEYDWSSWPAKEIKTEPMLFELGSTGTGNIIACITSATPAEEIEGIPPIEFPEPDYGGWSMPANAETFTGFYRFEKAPVTPTVPSISITPSNVVAYVNRLG